MLATIAGIRAAWEEQHRLSSAFIAGLDPGMLAGAVPDSPGVTVQEFAAHLAVDSDGLIVALAPRLAQGKGPAKMRIPRWLPGGSTGSAAVTTAEALASATPAVMSEAADQLHEQAKGALDAIERGQWDRRADLSELGKLTLAELVQNTVMHDQAQLQKLRTAVGASPGPGSAASA